MGKPQEKRNRNFGSGKTNSPISTGIAMSKTGQSKAASQVIVLGATTVLEGFLRFKETLCIQGKFKGTIGATGSLIVDKGAVVEADYISVSSLTVYGSVSGQVRAVDKIDLLPGSTLKGDITAGRLRIADGVLFEGHCSMAGSEREVEIFSRPLEDIKADLHNPAPDWITAQQEEQGAGGNQI
jgi:cytoskeletal protein CcmA (bactofilin family)